MLDMHGAAHSMAQNGAAGRLQHLVLRGALFRGRDLRQRPHDAVYNVVYVCKVALQLALLWPLQRSNHA
jgi:hypothetical protein